MGATISVPINTLVNRFNPVTNMFSSYYSKSSGFSLPRADMSSQPVDEEEGAPLLYSSFVVKNTSCREGCKLILNDQTETKEVHKELHGIPGDLCYVPSPRLGDDGLLPSVNISGSTILIVIVILRELQKLKSSGVNH